jgi:hypothetical protein
VLGAARGGRAEARARVAAEVGAALAATERFGKGGLYLRGLASAASGRLR